MEEEIFLEDNIGVRRLLTGSLSMCSDQDKAGTQDGTEHRGRYDESDNYNLFVVASCMVHRKLLRKGKF
jgi:hypothetical protein